MNDIAEKISNQETLTIISDYVFLSQLPEMNECQLLRYEQILTLAEDDEVLDFLVHEVDHILAHNLGLIDMKAAKDDQAVLRERLGTRTIPKNIDRKIGELVTA